MLAIIPARGGSKGLPGKNIRLFNGEPLICVTIKEAMKSKKIKRVVVSTDDDEIAAIAKKCGAEVPFMRPHELATDSSPAIDAYFYTVDQLKREFGEVYDDIIILFPTAPLRCAKHIDEAINIYYEKEADSVISVTESLTPVEWTRAITDEGKLVEYFDNGNRNRQDYNITYIPNGLLYIFRVNRLRETRNYYMNNTYPYIIEKAFYGDIDDIDDFMITEYKYRMNADRGYYE